MSSVRKKKLATASFRSVEKREKESIRSDNVNDRRCVNIETSEKRCVQAFMYHFETDNRTDKTLSSIPKSDVRERNIKERESDKNAFPQDIQRYSLKSYRRQFEILFYIRDTLKIEKIFGNWRIIRDLLVREREFSLQIYHTNKLLSR